MPSTDDPPGGTDRRDVLRAMGGLPLAARLPDVLGSSVPRAMPVTPLDDWTLDLDHDRDPSAVFPQGIASGDPTPEGAVVWTRIDPDAYEPGTGLYLEVSAGTGFQRHWLWAVDTDDLGPDRDYTVKVDLDGRIDPGREYFYRFVYGRVSSTIGHFRTLPRPGHSVDSVSFAVVNCQDYRNGYYGAYDYVAEADVDYILHLGDFIYEHGGRSASDGRGIELPSGNRTAMGLDDFRHLYRTYLSDPHLQRALASNALIATWDDHEIYNDRYWDYEADRPRGDHPRSDDAEFMTELVADGIRAWWEYLPVRVRYDPGAEHLHDQLRLWRSFRFGDLLELLVTDERLFRSAPDGETRVSLPEDAAPGEVDLDHTMLGDTQRAWFADTAAGSDATWLGWANEVLNAPLSADFRGESLVNNEDAWDGYEAERRLLMDHLDAEADGSVVVLTGDLHTALASILRTRYGRGGDRVGVELMTPAVTSANLRETADLPDSEFVAELLSRAVREQNPHIGFFDSFHHGYAVVEFTPDACTYTAYAVDKSVDARRPAREQLAALTVPVDRPAIRRR